MSDSDSDLIYIVYNNVEGDSYPVAAMMEYEEALRIIRNKGKA